MGSKPHNMMLGLIAGRFRCPVAGAFGALLLFFTFGTNDLHINRLVEMGSCQKVFLLALPKSRTVEMKCLIHLLLQKKQLMLSLGPLYVVPLCEQR